MMSDPQIHKPDSFDEVESPCEELSPDQIRISELDDKQVSAKRKTFFDSVKAFFTVHEEAE